MALRDASANPLRRPIFRISTVAGIVVAAMHRTMIETGKVASVASGVSSEPIIPPSVTMTIAPVAEISWHPVSVMILRIAMRPGLPWV